MVFWSENTAVYPAVGRGRTICKVCSGSLRVGGWSKNATGGTHCPVAQLASVATGLAGSGSSRLSRAVPCRVWLCWYMWRRVQSPCHMSYRAIAVPCTTVPYRVVQCRAVPCRAVPCRAVSRRAGPASAETPSARRAHINIHGRRCQ